MEGRSAKPWEKENNNRGRNNNNNAQQHAAAPSKKKPVVAHGIVGAVPSADKVVIYLNEEKKEGGKWVAPRKVEVKLSWVKGPKPHFLVINEETGLEDDQPQGDFFWEARENLRKIAIGKPARIEVRPNEERLGAREIGTVQIKDGDKTIDLSQYVVQSGYADVVLPKNYQQNLEGGDASASSGGQGGQPKRTPKPNENITKLVELEKEAKNKNLGKFQTSKSNAQLEPLLDFNHKNKYTEWRGTDEKQRTKHKCVVEGVMSGSMVKVTILPSMEQIALRIAGVRAPAYVRPNNQTKDQTSEPFGAEAQWTTERYTLHRDAEVVFTGFDQDKEVKNQPVTGVYYGELFIKDHSIGEVLLTSGLASFVQWSAPKDKVDKYRQLEEKSAASKQKIWSQPGKVSSTAQITQAAEQSSHNSASQGDKGKQSEAPTKGSRSFNGRVKSVTNGALYVIEDLDTPNHQAKTVTLSSIVVPKFGRGDRGRHQEGDDEEHKTEKTADEPFCWEAREFARKKILGKNVKVTVDYIRPEMASKDPKQKGPKGAVPAKAYHTVEFEGKNVGLGLVENGLATVLPGAGDNRSPIYESLQMAQDRAQKNHLGVHGPKKAARKGYNDVTSNKKASSGILPTLQGKTVEGVVEYVISGNRFKVSLPREQLIIIVVLDGVKTPALPRRVKETKDGKEVEKEVPGEPFAHEALEFSRNLCHQADVSVTVDRQDKAGSFIGYLIKGKQNVAEMILAEGLGRSVRSSKQHESAFSSALQQAKDKRKGIWKDWDPAKEEEEKRKAAAESEDSGVKDESIKVIVHVTEIIDSNKFYCQFIDEGKEVEQLNKYMSAFAGMNLSAGKEHEPARNEVVLAQFSGDGNWYRAQVRNITGKNVSVFYGDFGNSETTTSEFIRKLPEEYNIKTLRFQARECGLAYVRAVSPAMDADLAEEAAYELKRLIYDQKLPATREYSRPESRQSRNKLVYLNLWANDEQNTYINGELVRRGLAKVDKRLPRDAPETAVRLLRDMEDLAHDNKTGLWVSGDPGDEEENENN